jgi:hypothetical protein
MNVSADAPDAQPVLRIEHDIDGCDCAQRIGPVAELAYREQ